MSSDDELRRLILGPRVNERPDGLIVQLVALCNGDARAVLDRSREVLAVVFGQSDSLAIDQWRDCLPEWFVKKCAAEITQEEAERRKRLPLEKRVEFARLWSLSGWLYWFRSDDRPWRWWSSEAISPDSLLIQLVVPGLPYPSGSIEWLLHCAGAVFVERSEQKQGSE